MARPFGGRPSRWPRIATVLFVSGGAIAGGLALRPEPAVHVPAAAPTPVMYEILTPDDAAARP